MCWEGVGGCAPRRCCDDASRACVRAAKHARQRISHRFISHWTLTFPEHSRRFVHCSTTDDYIAAIERGRARNSPASTFLSTEEAFRCVSIRTTPRHFRASGRAVFACSYLKFFHDPEERQHRGTACAATTTFIATAVLHHGAWLIVHTQTHVAQRQQTAALFPCYHNDNHMEDVWGGGRARRSISGRPGRYPAATDGYSMFQRTHATASMSHCRHVGWHRARPRSHWDFRETGRPSERRHRHRRFL